MANCPNSRIRSEMWLPRTMRLRHHVTAKANPNPNPNPCDRTKRLRYHVTQADRHSREQTHHLVIPWNVEGTLGMTQRQCLGFCKSIRTKRGRSESDREEGWGIRLTILLGRRWPGDNSLCFASTTMSLTQYREVVLQSVDALVAWSVPCPPYPHMGIFMWLAP